MVSTNNNFAIASSKPPCYFDRLEKKEVAVITASKIPSELGGRDYSYFFFQRSQK